MLLFDENLSFRIADAIQDLFPSSVHVTQVGLKSANDTDIWSYAAYHALTIISKDKDFLERSALRGHPPKVIRLMIPNSTTDEIIKILRNQNESIHAFLRREDLSSLTLTT